MLLSSRTLVPYLLDRGLLRPETVVDGDVSVHEMSRRNRNFRVTQGALPGLFVKQTHDWETFSMETLRREAACYQLARDDPSFEALGAMMPRLVEFDAASHVLTLELLPDAETLADHFRRLGHFPLDLAARLGTLLGSYHRQAGSRARDAALDRTFPRGLPWILHVTHHNPSHLGPVSGGNQALVGMLERYPAWGRAIDEVREGWRREALVHGDLKWENCVVLPPAAPGQAPALKIVDWELADFGDPAWDLGSVFQAYLSFWILSMRDADTAAAADLPERAEFPIERMQPAINAFWTAYAATLGLQGAAATERLHRGMRYAGCRMVQTAWEHTAHLPAVPPNVLVILQVSMNVLTRPEEAVRDLLGLEGRRAA